MDFNKLAQQAQQMQEQMQKAQEEMANEVVEGTAGGGAVVVKATDQAGDNSWPMTAATWILVYKQPADTAATGEALKFFAWAYKNGGKMAEELDYVPMPEVVVKDVEKYWAKEIKDASGKPVFAMTN